MNPTDNRVPVRELDDRICRLQRVLAQKGIENTLLVTEDGAEVLTRSTESIQVI